MIQGLVISYDVYEDLLAKSQKGVEFYKKLGANVTRLLERTRRVSKEQEKERQMVMEKHKARGDIPGELKLLSQKEKSVLFIWHLFHQLSRASPHLLP